MNRCLLPVAAILPVAAAVVAYVLGEYFQRIPSCVPFFDGCTSISATGRNPPGSYVFKSAYLVQSVLLWLVWREVAAVMRRPPRIAARFASTVLAAGLVGALALVVYTLTLGSQVPLYEFMRRFGIYFYFIGVLVCQVTTSVYCIRTCAVNFAGSPIGYRMLAVSLLPLAAGLLNFALKAAVDDAGAWQNRIEWWAALVMQSWFLLLHAAWPSLRRYCTRGVLHGSDHS